MISYRDFNQYNRTTLPIYCKLLVEPASRLIALPLINYTQVKPYQVTLLGLILAFISAHFFLNGSYVIAAIIFQLTVILDFVDGYVAKVKHNGSVFGILLDGYADILRVLVNILALVISVQDDPVLGLLLMIFLFLHAAESLIDFELTHVRRFLNSKKEIKLNGVDRSILWLKAKMERFGLRTIFLYTQERIFFVLFLGPVLEDIKFWTIAGIALVVTSIHIKMILDVAIIKNSILHNARETLK